MLVEDSHEPQATEKEMYYYKTSIRFKNGMWIPNRKRLYLYWFKYLQVAEQSNEFDVDWNKYSGWGGSNYILGVKFDEFWNDRWEKLFGIKNQSDKSKFPLSTKQPKAEGIRLALLCWERKGKKKKKPNLVIAKEVYEYELGISKEKKPRMSEDEFSASNLNPDGEDAEGYDIDKQMLQSYISRYLKRAKKTLTNVSNGQFP